MGPSKTTVKKAWPFPLYPFYVVNSSFIVAFYAEILSQIHIPDWGIYYTVVDSGIGLSYRPAPRLHRLAGRYDNPMPELTLSPQSGVDFISPVRIYEFGYCSRSRQWRRVVVPARWLKNLRTSYSTFPMMLPMM